MKQIFSLLIFSALSILPFYSTAQTATAAIKTTGKHLYIDVHQLEPGKVKYQDVAKAHAKDLKAEKKYGVHFIKYWLDEDKGLVYCLSSASDTQSIRETHRNAHGLLPFRIYEVTDGVEAVLSGKNELFLDVHELGAGNVTASAVGEAHKKDLAVQKKYDVNFINYWVDEQTGTVLCLSQAPSADAIVNTHKEAHGLIPISVEKVIQGQ